MPTTLRSFAAILLLAACGDALAGEDYVGEPIARLDGTITTSSGMVVPANVRLALVWHMPIRLPSDPHGTVHISPPVEGRVELDPQGALAFFTVNVYEPPPAEAFIYPEHGDVPYAMGVLWAYQDTHGNGQLDCAPWSPLGSLEPNCFDKVAGQMVSQDKLVGAVLNTVVVYAPDTWPDNADAVFAEPRYNALGEIVSYDPGIRPQPGINFVHLSPVIGDHAAWTKCWCVEHPCSAPPAEQGHVRGQEGKGWQCRYKGDPSSPLQAKPRASLTWPDNELPELRIVHDVRDAVYEPLLEPWQFSHEVEGSRR